MSQKIASFWFLDPPPTPQKIGSGRYKKNYVTEMLNLLTFHSIINML